MFQSSLQSRIGECGGSSNLGLCIFAARILIAGTPFSFNPQGNQQTYANIVILDHPSIREQHENLENGIWFANTIR
jgi:hypothetical protein